MEIRSTETPTKDKPTTHTHFCAENSLPREPNAKQKQLLVSIDKEKHGYPK